MLISLFLLGAVDVQAQDEEQQQDNSTNVGWDQKLGETVPMDLEFTNSDGKNMNLEEIIDMPTILALVYYDCPGICNPTIMEAARVVDVVDLKPGKDFQVLTVSFDHTEGTDFAKKWKKEHMSGMNRDISDDDWYFMVGDSANVNKLASSVGFNFKPDGKGDFVHPSGIMVLDQNGRIARYLLGTEYLKFDLKMSVIEASKGRSIPTQSKVLQFCFAYDPEGQSYVFNFTKVFGTLIFAALAVFFLVLVLKGKGKKRRNERQSA